jgi:hypothetical protein
MRSIRKTLANAKISSAHTPSPVAPQERASLGAELEPRAPKVLGWLEESGLLLDPLLILV